MLNRSKLAAVGLLAAVFLAGGLAGWGGREAAARVGGGAATRAARLGGGASAWHAARRARRGAADCRGHAPGGRAARIAGAAGDGAGARRPEQRQCVDASEHWLVPADDINEWVVAAQRWNSLQLDYRSDRHGAGEHVVQRRPVGEYRAVRWFPATRGCPLLARGAKRGPSRPHP